MKRIALYVKQEKEAQKKANELEAWLLSQNIQVIQKQAYSPENSQDKKNGLQGAAPPDLFCVFVLGGDGTFLSASRWIGAHPIPLIGVKFGEIGFLAKITEEDLFSSASHILSGDFAVEARTRLLVKIIRNDKTIAEETVLNDVVINKGALARLANLQTYINDHYLTTYKSDGLIVASPTGSTAYSLAAGGPIIHPDVQGIIITPICPFTLTNRCMILPDTVSIKIRLGGKGSDLMITFDGQVGLKIDHKDTILITKSAHPLHMITLPEQNYFDILKEKLRWSGGRM